jgi:DNA-nicking Smr family endonuclease
MTDDNPRIYNRRLSASEVELWTAVTADVRPFRARPAPPPAAEGAPLAPSPMGRSALTEDVKAQPARAHVPLAEIDSRTRTKIRRGRLEVDVKLDLHGLRQAEAHRALVSFLRRAQAEGAKIAIVVTGKGDTRGEGGVLRRLAPVWLEAPNLRDVVVGFGEAERQHGGEGALYVRIRRADRRR